MVSNTEALPKGLIYGDGAPLMVRRALADVANGGVLTGSLAGYRGGMMRREVSDSAILKHQASD